MTLIKSVNMNKKNLDPKFKIGDTVRISGSFNPEKYRITCIHDVVYNQSESILYNIRTENGFRVHSVPEETLELVQPTKEEMSVNMEFIESSELFFGVEPVQVWLRITKDLSKPDYEASVEVEVCCKFLGVGTLDELLTMEAVIDTMLGKPVTFSSEVDKIRLHSISNLESKCSWVFKDSYDPEQVFITLGGISGSVAQLKKIIRRGHQLLKFYYSRYPGLY